jgi:hypothetical protein
MVPVTQLSPRCLDAYSFSIVTTAVMCDIAVSGSAAPSARLQLRLLDTHSAPHQNDNSSVEFASSRQTNVVFLQIAAIYFGEMPNCACLFLQVILMVCFGCCVGDTDWWAGVLSSVLLALECKQVDAEYDR